jgi:hypothetical protein
MPPSSRSATTSTPSSGVVAESASWPRSTSSVTRPGSIRARCGAACAIAPQRDG